MMTTTPTEFAFVLIASMLMSQAFAVGCLWLFVEFIRGPEKHDDWYTDEEQPQTLESKLFAARAALMKEKMMPDTLPCHRCGTEIAADIHAEELGMCLDCSNAYWGHYCVNCGSENIDHMTQECGDCPKTETTKGRQHNVR